MKRRTGSPVIGLHGSYILIWMKKSASSEAALPPSGDDKIIAQAGGFVNAGDYGSTMPRSVLRSRSLASCPWSEGM